MRTCTPPVPVRAFFWFHQLFSFGESWNFCWGGWIYTCENRCIGKSNFLFCLRVPAALALGMPPSALPSVGEDSQLDSAEADAEVLAKPPGSRLSLNLDSMAAGEHKLGDADFLTTARAANEVAITVRGDAKVKATRIMELKPNTLGKGKVKAAWRPITTKRRVSSQLAVACEKDGNLILSLYTRAKMPTPIDVHNLGPGRVTWLDWDCNGKSLALMQEGVGLYLWDVPEETPNGQPAALGSVPLKLAPSITNAASFCAWSKKFLQLAIGTHAGKVRARALLVPPQSCNIY